MARSSDPQSPNPRSNPPPPKSIDDAKDAFDALVGLGVNDDVVKDSSEGAADSPLFFLTLLESSNGKLSSSRGGRVLDILGLLLFGDFIPTGRGDTTSELSSSSDSSSSQNVLGPSDLRFRTDLVRGGVDVVGFEVEGRVGGEVVDVEVPSAAALRNDVVDRAWVIVF